MPGGVDRLPGPPPELRRTADDLVRRLRRWTPAGWATPADAPGAVGTAGARAADAGWSAGAGRGTRADVVAAAVQRIADLGLAAEGERRRLVPRLGDAVLPDQLAVVVDDVLRTADPAAVAALATELTALRATLLSRR